MAIFRREPEPQSPASPIPASPAPSPARREQTKVTMIAQGTEIEGRVLGSCDLQIEGTLTGEVKLQSNLVVGSSGHVKGDVHARTVRVSGKVTGNVSGTDRIELLASGTLEGDVAAPRVIIAEGAFFKGRVEMVPQKGAAAGKPQSPPEGKQEKTPKKAGE